MQSTFTKPRTIAEYNSLTASIPQSGVWTCTECSESLDPFEGAEGAEWETIVLGSTSNYGTYRDEDRTPCEWCGTAPRDMLYRTFVFPAVTD